MPGLILPLFTVYAGDSGGDNGSNAKKLRRGTGVGEEDASRFKSGEWPEPVPQHTLPYYSSSGASECWGSLR